MCYFVMQDMAAQQLWASCQKCSGAIVPGNKKEKHVESLESASMSSTSGKVLPAQSQGFKGFLCSGNVLAPLHY